MVIDISCGFRTNWLVKLADPKRGFYRRRAAGAIHDLWQCGNRPGHAAPTGTVFSRLT